MILTTLVVLSEKLPLLSVSVSGESMSHPTKEFLDRNLVVSLGSDGPCTHPNPLQWIHNAVNHSNKEQAISLEDALKNGHL